MPWEALELILKEVISQELGVGALYFLAAGGLFLVIGVVAPVILGGLARNE